MVSKNTENEENKKKELIEIGLRLFSENGMSNFSIRKLVEEANVSIGLFYYYFESKENFILNCVEIYNQTYIVKLEQILANKNIAIIDRIDLALGQYLIQFSELFRIDAISNLNRLIIEDLLIKKVQPLLENLIKEGLDSHIFKVSNVKIASYFIACGLVGILIKMNLTDEDRIQEETNRIIYSVLSIN